MPSTSNITTTRSVTKSISSQDNLELLSHLDKELWNISPKTDYTYAESIMYNKSKNEEYNTYPNMSRYSYHSNGSDRDSKYNLRSQTSTTIMDITPNRRRSNSNMLQTAISNTKDDQTISSKSHVTLQSDLANTQESQSSSFIQEETINLDLASDSRRNKKSNKVIDANTMASNNQLNSLTNSRLSSQVNNEEYLSRNTNQQNIIENKFTISKYFSETTESIFQFFKNWIYTEENKTIDISKRNINNRRPLYENANINNKRWSWCCIWPLFLLPLLVFWNFGWFFASWKQAALPLPLLNDSQMYNQTELIQIINGLRMEITEIRQLTDREIKKHVQETHHLLDKKLLLINDEIDNIKASNIGLENKLNVDLNMAKNHILDKSKLSSTEELNKFVHELTNEPANLKEGSNAFLMRAWLLRHLLTHQKDAELSMQKLNQDLQLNLDSRISSQLETALNDLRQTIVPPVAPPASETSYTCSQCASPQDVKDEVKGALRLYDADKTGKPDYALESVGGSIVNVRCTETYKSGISVYQFLGFPIYYHYNGPRTIIQPSVHAGECWPFVGSHGNVVIRMGQEVSLSHVSIEHLPLLLKPSSFASSAPKDYIVKGLLNESDEEGKLLAMCQYDINGETIQYCPIKAEKAYQFVEFEFTSNHGNPNYTCIYRVRIHGDYL